ncbi:unnamed protein product [Rotaria socialis]|uniref:Uncharacterized protein n=1 Tax=Rotaria socialis TaxID=392032 RepID=A0A817TUR5_9BILA|nr:unnamed protein product [Rotaria socialis]CAF3325496.1 unnamed protein product [Rotaria socialis]CAF3336918.1 unnamed protein product [Rotaria socialis]CAF3423733.1 unnamed protein product [Rotaria socialis]CAF3667566.1 unnamed protein product [Rotaria socialis]
MSVPPTRRRKGSGGRNPVSEHYETKNGTSGNKSTRTKSTSDEPTIAHSKLDTKKYNSSNALANITRSADDSHGHTAKKSHGRTIIDDTHPHAKTRSHSDGKTAKHDTQTKTSTRSTTKKSDVHKSPTNKHNKTKQRQ